MPADLAFAAACHEFGDPERSDQQSVVISLRELPSDACNREAAWNQLGPAAHEAWRQELFDEVRGEPDLAEGLLDFACRWLEQTATLDFNRRRDFYPRFRAIAGLPDEWHARRNGPRNYDDMYRKVLKSHSLDQEDEAL